MSDVFPILSVGPLGDLPVVPAGLSKVQGFFDLGSRRLLYGFEPSSRICLWVDIVDIPIGEARGKFNFVVLGRGSVN